MNIILPYAAASILQILSVILVKISQLYRKIYSPSKFVSSQSEFGKIPESALEITITPEKNKFFKLIF